MLHPLVEYFLVNRTTLHCEQYCVLKATPQDISAMTHCRTLGAPCRWILNRCDQRLGIQLALSFHFDDELVITD
jgi:hypothetical protein